MAVWFEEDELDAVAWDFAKKSDQRAVAEAHTQLTGEGTTPTRELLRQVMPGFTDPREQAGILRERVVNALGRNFAEPVRVTDARTGESISLELLGGLQAEEPPDPYDYKKIHDSLMKGQTYGLRIKGRFRIAREDKDGKVKQIYDDQEVTLARVPTPIFDRSYVVAGKKRHLANQFRRRPGVFTLQDAKGDYVTEFNVDQTSGAKVKNFRVWMDRTDDQGPEFRVSYGTAEMIPAWDVAQLLGASERDLQKAAGDDVAKTVLGRANSKRYERTVTQLHRAVLGDASRTDSLSLEDKENELREQFGMTRFDPEIMERTMGLRDSSLSKDVLLRSFGKLKALANEEIAPDDRESLTLKRVMSPADLLAEAVGRDREVSEYRRYLAAQLRKARGTARTDAEQVSVKQVLGNKVSPKLNARLTSSMLQQTDTATNPMDNWAASSLTTIMGEGAIQSDMAVPVDAKLINPSHLGFLDPTHSPESDKAGVSLHHTARTRIVPETRRNIGGPETGSSRLVSTFMLPSGKTVEMSPDEVAGKVVGAFDQFELRDGRPRAKFDRVLGFKDGRPVDVRPGEVDIWLPDQLAMFDAQTSLVPLTNSAQGNRAGYASKQGSQAVPLVEREAPLVQVQVPGTDYSVEELLGEEAGAVRAPFDGEVVAVRDEGPGERVLVVKKGGRGDKVEIPLPKNLPMGGHTPLDSTVRVQVGQRFKRGDLLADSTFTKDGTLAVGTNVRVAYMPHYANTFEDAVAISERMAAKMRSAHLYTVDVDSDQIRLGKKHYALRGEPLPRGQWDKLTAEGIVPVGTRVEPGDPLIVGTRGVALGDRDLQEKLALMGQFSKKDRRKLTGQTTAYTHLWKEEVPGEVVAVDLRKDREGAVKGARLTIRTEEPMQAGDKLYGRHGNKGVVSKVLSNDEMPFIPGRVDVIDPGGSPFRKGQEISEEEALAASKKYPDFKYTKAHVDLLLNPLGVAGRLNPSQSFETMLARAAVKNGRPEKVRSFGYIGDDSNWDFTDRRLREEGLEPNTALVLPETGRVVKDVGVGYQYILKAKQTVAKKNSARGLGAFQKNGLVAHGDEGGRALGELGVYGLLAQDAREFLRDAALYKSENREEVWRALRQGRPLGDSGVRVNDEPLAFKRLLTYMRAAGIEPIHEPDKFTYRLRPQTDADVVQLTRTSVGQGKTRDRVFSDPTQTIDAKARPRPGGLFDPLITGGMNGNQWGRFELAQAVPNPIYEGAIQDLLNVKGDEYADLIAGRKAVEVDGKEYYGAEAVERMLDRVDLDKAFAEATEVAKKGRDSDRSTAYRKLRSIHMLRENKMTPVQAFMRKQIPVAPMQLRTLDIDEKGQPVVGDLNFLYRDIALTNAELQTAKKKGLPPAAVGQLEAGLYESMRTLMQVQGSKPLSPSAEYQGILGVLTGQHPDGTGDLKRSLFKDQVVQRRQTFSGGAVLAADDSLGIDQAAIPKSVAAALFEADVEAEWGRANPSGTPEKRQAFLKKLKDYHQLGKKDPEVDELLRRAVKRRQVIVKRDPVLHKYGIQAFDPVLTDRNTIGLNPMVFGGYNADSVLGDVYVCDPVLRVVDIAEFPREGEPELRDSGVSVFRVPDGVTVPTYVDGEFRLCPVTEFSVHPDCEEWVVTLSDGQVLRMAATHSVAAFDPETLSVRKAHATDAVGLWVPSMSYLPAPGQTAPARTEEGRVPLPDDIRAELLTALSSRGASKKHGRIPEMFSSYVTLRRNKGSLPYEQVALLLQRIPDASARVQQWARAVTHPSVKWCRVISSRPTGEYVEMYDLKVPGPFTFTMASGAVVWDSDGDVLGIFVPLTEEANREARDKLRPSKNLFNPSSGGLEYALGHESVLGIARATRNSRIKSDVSFASINEAEKAWDRGDIEADQEVRIAGKRTTVGRELFSAALPPGVDFETLVKEGVIKEGGLDVGVSKKEGNLSRVLRYIATQHTEAYGESANALRQLGQKVATYSGASLTLQDLKPVLRDERKQTAAALREELHAIRSRKDVTPAERQRQVETVFGKHIRSLNAVQSKLWQQMVEQPRPSTMPELVLSGARASQDQLKQMLSAPVALVDGRNQVVDQPVMRNYSEGLTATDYWTAAHGARMGAINKVIQVREPGYLTKQIVNTAIDQVVTEKDCGTKRFVEINVNNTSNGGDLVGRILAAPVRAGRLNLAAGHPLTQDEVQEMQRVLKGDEPFHLRVRSPLRCEAKAGICQKCAGYDPTGDPVKIGTNLGVIAAQALGERSTQLTLSTFHGGGVFSPGQGTAANLYEQAKNLLRMPSTMGGKPAIVYGADATVKEVRPNRSKGGWDVITKEDDAPNIFIPKNYRAPWESKKDSDDRPPEIPEHLKPGTRLRRGDILTDGVANPKDLLRATGDIGSVQDYMTSRLHGLFASQNILRRNVETVVKSMTDTVEVAEPGESPFDPGQKIPRQMAEKYREQFKGLTFRPVLRGVDVMPRERSEDWMAKLNFNNLRDVITESAQIGARSNYHSTNPIPALAVGRYLNRPPAGAESSGVY